jgi:uncharacterized DUF497 family protein
MSTDRQLRWDPRNIAHIARHGVNRDEVEEVLRGDFITQSSYGGRRILIGSTATGRTLAVVLEEETEDVSYVVTARPASRKERRALRSVQEGDQDE